eukprot:12921486-Prorocentrum_lima.AAC.1
MPVGNNIQRALMNDPGEPCAMWDSGASHFVLAMTSFPKRATGVTGAMVRLAVGDAQPVYSENKLYCLECRTPLIPADK